MLACTRHRRGSSSRHNAALRPNTNAQPHNRSRRTNTNRQLLADVAAAQDDPLPAWLAYVRWTQEAFPASRGKGRLLEALEAATKALSGAERYYNDPRFLRLWIQYVSAHRG